MHGTIPLDDVDLMLLDLLRAEGRATVAELARAVNLSPAPVGRRIARLERAGVIAGYTAIVDEGKVGGVEAFAELRVTGDADVSLVAELAAAVPEAEEVFTVAGDPDALVRVRVRDAEHLRQVINRLRHSEGVVGTRTLLVLSSWRRAERPRPQSG
jgi:DNA-binding Lrp family transcriptional regulator